MSPKILTLTLIFIIVLTSGCISSPKLQSAQPTPTPAITPVITPSSTLPRFQPDMWDKAVIEPPAGQEDLHLPFMFEIDINSSYGFERKYLEHETFGKPIFVISRGKSASIILLLNSSSNRTIQVSQEEIELIEGTFANLKPELYVLQPNERARLELNVTASLEAPISTPRPESAPEEFATLRLKGNGWSVGRAFILKIN